MKKPIYVKIDLIDSDSETYTFSIVLVFNDSVSLELAAYHVMQFCNSPHKYKHHRKDMPGLEQFKHYNELVFKLFKVVNYDRHEDREYIYEFEVVTDKY